MIWLYAICDRPELPPPAALEGLVEGGLMGVYARRAHAPGQPSAEALWAHEQIVEQLMADRTVLPMRFGSTLSDEASLRALLIEHHERFATTLARVSGRVEIGVRVRQTTAVEPPVAATGRDYILAKLRSDSAAAELHSSLAGLSVEASRQPPQGDGEVLRGAYLVDGPVVERFRGAVQELQRANPDAAILCTGPWPPYSFVN